MPSCCVPMCKNSSAKGFLLKCFPKNGKRRAQWIKNIDRSNWSPNHSHRVCEAHFAPHMWEKIRVDGSRKLKFNAVPTIFGDCTIDKSCILESQVYTSENNNENDEAKPKISSLKNIVLSNNQAIIKIISPPTSRNLQSIPILIPTATICGTPSINPTSAIIVNSHGKVISSHLSPSMSGTTSILKPHIKTMNAQLAPVIISTNSRNVRNQLECTKSQTSALIPLNTGSLKSQVQTNLQLSSMNSFNTQTKALGTPPVLVPVTTNNAKSKIENINTESQLNPDSDKSEPNALNNQTTLTSPSIILNKLEAKKIEDERFDKMDKLLLKQLRLNNALRKKLNLMSHKIQQLMKEQKNDFKAFLMDVFTEDQIRALELRHSNPKSITAWSYETMIKAIKLKQECGSRGYEELLNQNLPLPSVRTISRWCTARNIPIP